MEISEIDKELFIKYAKFIFGKSFPDIQHYEDMMFQKWKYILISPDNKFCVFIESLGSGYSSEYYKHYRAIKIVDLWPEYK